MGSARSQICGSTSNPPSPRAVPPLSMAHNHPRRTQLAHESYSPSVRLHAAGRFLQLLQRVPEIAPGIGEEPLVCHGDLQLGPPHILMHVCMHEKKKKRVSVTDQLLTSSDGVEFAYPSRPDAPVLCGVHISASPGTMTALVGESGAGIPPEWLSTPESCRGVCA